MSDENKEFDILDGVWVHVWETFPNEKGNATT